MSFRNDIGMYMTDTERAMETFKIHPQPDDPGIKLIVTHHWEYFWAGFGIGAFVEMVVAIAAWFS